MVGMYERKTFSSLSDRSVKERQKVEPATIASDRSSAAEARKSNKPLLEKKRRARINRSLEQLKNILIDSVKNDQTTSGYSKLEKADILEMTVKHLKNLQHEHAKKSSSSSSSSSGDSAATMLRYKAGFSECVNEVDRFLSSLESSLNPEIRLRLINHLAELSRAPSSTLYRNPAQPLVGMTLPAGLGPQNPQWTQRTLMGDFPSRSGPFSFQEGLATTTTSAAVARVSPLVSRQDANSGCDCSDGENILCGQYIQGSRNVVQRPRKRSRYDTDHKSRQQQQQQPLNHSFNSSFTISSTTSPFSSPQQQQSRILKDRNVQPQLATATGDDSGFGDSKRQPLHCQRSPVSPLTPTRSPHHSDGTASTSGDSGGCCSPSPRDLGSLSVWVKDEPVWRPW